MMDTTTYKALVQAIEDDRECFAVEARWVPRDPEVFANFLEARGLPTEPVVIKKYENRWLSNQFVIFEVPSSGAWFRVSSGEFLTGYQAAPPKTRYERILED